ncbi:hypothetical protein LCER1_G006686 [Lachnellula cervina]|uniref:Malate dehydrogenase n=1 Tax=Lachnellula cervina TaxID=1316786 RepID=A0A7D8YLW4_9HELO|nr:hypothetical protein LCER1_G006686 [Lachnellula cervina]
MPSMSTILKSLALASLVNLVAASPVGPPAIASLDCKTATPTGATATQTGAAPTIPTSGSKLTPNNLHFPDTSNKAPDTPDLPATALKLVYVAVGRGTQNYTCAAAGKNSTATGAKATLFDATSLAYANISAVHAIPPVAVDQAIPTGPMPASSGPLSILGHHFFDSAGTPTFDLSAADKILFGAKTGDVKAPAGSSKGPAGTGAVDWLSLTAKPAPYVSEGLSFVYRVVTAGGVAPACTAAGEQIVQYSAEYWFYV